MPPRLQRPPAAGPRAPALPFDVLESKLRIPAPRPGSVSRTALVNRLRVAGPHRLATVVAPAGYGKTTVLAQWAERDARPFAWVSVDERDDDPIVLLRHVAAALHRLAPLGAAALEPLRAARGSVWTTAVPRLAAVLAARGVACVLVLDGVSRLTSAESLEPVLAVAEHLPEGSLLVLAGRSLAFPPIAALRAAGRLHELGPDRLALGRREAGLLLRAEGVELPGDRLDELLRRTEGWPAGVALALRDGGAELDAGDRDVVDYLHAECVSGLAPARLDFLVRTSALERMCGPLCDAVLDRAGSAAELEAIETAGLFLVPLDRSRTWFRYHALFRDVLRRELERREIDVAAIHGRAADWLEVHGEPEAAIDHAAAAGELGRAARLLAATVAPTFGGLAKAERRLGLLAGPELPPDAAALAAWVHVLGGRTAEAARLLGAAGPAAALVVRAALCPDGAKRMEADAAAAVATLPAGSAWRPAALFLHGAARALLGDDRGLEDALALPAYDGPAAVFERAVSARALLRGGRWDEARAELAAAQAPVGKGLPWLEALARLELGRAHVTLRDADAAEALLAEARAILRRSPDLGVLPAQARELAVEVAAMRRLGPGGRSLLTAAELRLLPLLATHLSFREIGERLCVSRNTIKTQAVSVYRKLGVSSRSDAIAEAARLGLLSADFTPTG